MLGRTLGQAGDTIVEVIIAIAIISLVLVGAYVSVNKNTQTLQNTQERAMAQKIVASQIDSLHANGKLNASGDCFNSSGVEQPSTACKLNATGSGADYNVSITTPGSTPPAACNQNASPKSYTICAYWTSLGGAANNDSNVTVYYAL